MTATEYYNYFASRPSDKWTTGSMGDKDGNHCAVGWLRSDRTFGTYKYEYDLKQLFSKHGFLRPENVNDGFKDTIVFGDTPRERILTVLSQIILFENAEETPVTAPSADLVLA